VSSSEHSLEPWRTHSSMTGQCGSGTVNRSLPTLVLVPSRAVWFSRHDVYPSRAEWEAYRSTFGVDGGTATSIQIGLALVCGAQASPNFPNGCGPRS
jgi:hypothetical protein